jgi:hypothetical protein
MVGSTRGRFDFIAVFLRHSRVYLAVYWALVITLAAFAQGGFTHSISGTSRQSVSSQSSPATCTGGKVLVHFAESGLAQCLLVVIPSRP